MSIFDRFVQKGADIGQAGQRMRQVSALAAQLQYGEAEVQSKFPEDAEQMKPFFPKLKESLDRYRDKGRGKSGAGELLPVNAAVKFFLAPDRMAAFACLLPPMDGGRDIESAAFWEELRYEGISAGLQTDLAEDYIANKRYLRVFPVARGMLPRDGKDGAVTECFQRLPPLSIETARDRTMDFSQQRPVVIVHKGEVICRIRLPIAGVNGIDVTGRTLPCRDGVAPKVPMGTNTLLSSDGTELLSSEDGVLYSENDLFCVQAANVQTGPVTSALVGITGDLFVDGNVLEGGNIVAIGSVFVQGEVHGATIRATAGSIRIQAGIRDGARIEASGQVQAPLISDSTVRAGANIYAEVIADSDVTSGTTIFVNGGRGLILGGDVRARNRIVCTQLGNVSGKPGKLTVGYIPEVFQEIQDVENQLIGVRETLEKLRKSINGLRRGGETLSPEKRSFLGQMTEQRTLYEAQESSLLAKQKAAKEKLRAALSGKVFCQELYPPVTVQIGDRVKEFTVAETNCNIHVYAGQVVAK